jgi:hypothetical protein
LFGIAERHDQRAVRAVLLLQALDAAVVDELALVDEDDAAAG